MIISNSNKFIYFHIPKTGGTSLSYMLGRYSENVDKYPLIQELVGLLDDAYPEFETSKIKTHVAKCYAAMEADDVNRFYRKNPMNIRWMNLFHCGLGPHVMLSDNKKHSENLKEKSDIYSDYFKFAVVRNPWDYTFSVFKNKVVVEGVSQIYCEGMDWDTEVDSRITAHNFNTFIRNIEYYYQIQKIFLRPEVQQYRYITDMDDVLQVDYVARYENYNQELNYIGDNIGLTLDDNAMLNKSTVKYDNYKDYYNQESIDFVANIFAGDIEKFGYSYV